LERLYQLCASFGEALSIIRFLWRGFIKYALPLESLQLNSALKTTLEPALKTALKTALKSALKEGCAKDCAKDYVKDYAYAKDYDVC
jgi:hypothetical protein